MMTTFRRNALCLQLFLAATLGCLFAVQPSSAAEGETVWLPYPEEGVELGQGFDLLHGRKTSAVCIDFFQVNDAGLETNYEVSTLSTFAEAFSSFNISASGALKMALFSGSASLGFANSARTTSTGEMYAVTATVRRGAQFVSPVSGSKTAESDVADPADGATKAGEITFKAPTDITSIHNQCGNGYVSAVVLGVDLKATIDTSSSTTDEDSSFNGSLEFEALGGLISGGGSIGGTSESENRLKKSRVTSYILGGENYDVPTTVDNLAAFVKNLAKLTDENPRPMMIAVTPYTTVGSGSVIDGFEGAEALKPAIYGYFSAREAVDRLNYAIDYQASPPPNGKGVVLPNEVELHQALDVAYASMIKLKAGLSSCQTVLLQENRDRENAAREGVDLGDGAAEDMEGFFDRLSAVAAASRADAVRNAVASGRSGPGEEERFSVDECLVGLRGTTALDNANAVFLYSLLALPFYPTDFSRDPWSTPESLYQDAKALAESTVLEQLDLHRSNIAASGRVFNDCYWDKINAGADVQPGSASGSGLTDEEIAELATSVVDFMDLIFDDDAAKEECRKVEAAYVEEQRKEIEKLGDDFEKYNEHYSSIQGAIARQVYRSRFYSVRQGTCKTELTSPICSIDYYEAINQYESFLRLDKHTVALLGNALKPPAAEPVKETPPPKKKKPELKGFVLGNCGPPTIYLCP